MNRYYCTECQHCPICEAEIDAMLDAREDDEEDG